MNPPIGMFYFGIIIKECKIISKKLSFTDEKLSNVFLLVLRILYGERVSVCKCSWFPEQMTCCPFRFAIANTQIPRVHR